MFIAASIAVTLGMVAMIFVKPGKREHTARPSNDLAG